MNSALLVVLLAAAATAAVVSNVVPDMVKVPDVDKVADVVEVYDVDEVADFVELTDAAKLTDEAAVPAETSVATRQLSLSQGNIQFGDTRIYNNEHFRNGIAGQNITKLIPVDASSNRRVISAVRVNRIGSAQSARLSIVDGGVGRSYVTIMIQSALGRGFRYRVEVFER